MRMELSTVPVEGMVAEICHGESPTILHGGY